MAREDRRTVQTHWIEGRAIADTARDEIEVRNPATEVVIGLIPRGSESAIDAAAVAARKALSGWSRLSPTHRKGYLRGVALRLQAVSEDISRLLTLENGKPLRDARAEVAHAVDAAFAYAELSVHLRSGNQGAPSGELSFQHREPRGVVGCIVPWNFPLATAFGNVMPALAAGNTVIWKPSEKTPLSSRILMDRVFGELPAGVANMVLGDGANVGQAIVRHPMVDAVAFIGSERTGRQIAETCGRFLKKSILELGGKDPLIVDETVDISGAAKLAAGAAYANAGQICTSTERIYVQRTVVEPFVEALVREARALRVGDGLDEATDMGPLVDELQLQKVGVQVQDAIRCGAELRSGGVRLNRTGYFYPPTVLTGAFPDSTLMEEETFGPVAPIMSFDDFDQAIDMANRGRYGLAAIVCTTLASRAIKAIEELQVGTVKINAMRGRAPGSAAEPSKASGMGHGSGMEILYELTRQKSVHWRGSLA